MGDDEVPQEIPKIVLSGEVLGLERDEEAKSEAWKALARKVREACETYGCFVVEYEKIPIEVQEELFNTTKEMFDLPPEKKLQYTKPMPTQGGYVVNHPTIPLYEMFGVFGEHELPAFEKLMWPDHGKPGFCEFFNSMTAKMFELNSLLLRTIFESFGVGEYYYKSKVLDENIMCNFRAMKYKVPPKSSNNEEEGMLGLMAHTDKTILSILCQDSVQGLEALTKDGKWIPLNIPRGALVVVVGDALEVLSNGRLQAVKHRVMMRGDKERYSCGFFFIPKDGVTIEAPQELVDKDHPLLYRPFIYSEYRAKQLNNASSDSLKVYAGI